MVRDGIRPSVLDLGGGNGALFRFADRSHSGLVRRTRNAVRLQGLRGFESHPVRHSLLIGRVAEGFSGVLAGNGDAVPFAFVGSDGGEDFKDGSSDADENHRRHNDKAGESKSEYSQDNSCEGEQSYSTVQKHRLQGVKSYKLGLASFCQKDDQGDEPTNPSPGQ